MMRGIFRLVFKNGNTKPIQLGRWEHRMTEDKKEIKSILSNIDNCGDQICGKPTLLRKALEQQTILKKALEQKNTK